MTCMRLIRHAHVNPGRDARLYGWFDLPLSASGRAQLRRLEGRLSLPAPVALFSSTSRRSAMTARALAGIWRLEPELDPGLREIHCGTLEGVRVSEILRRHAELWASNLAQRDEDFTWPGGESNAGFRRRALDALDALARRHHGQQIVVVTHAGVINQVMGVARDRPASDWESFRPDPLSVTEVEWNGVRPRVVRFNDPLV